ncbi:MAG: hypothetical protein ACFE8E_07135 [Candidatus Hodarchaeota archaeon]
MQKVEVIRKLSIRIEDRYEEILKYIHIGISIPVLPEFHKYIISDIEEYNAKSILLEEEIDEKDFGKQTDNVVGHALVYDDGGEVLFFGFFNVYDHDPKKIELLADQVINYAEQNDFSIIRGPINVPTVIFGWGFMVEGSRKDLFIGSPINPPIYQHIFMQKGFSVKFQEDRYWMPALKMDPHNNPALVKKGVNFAEYEYSNPGKEGLMAIKDEYIGLHATYMPDSARITPKASKNFDNIVDFTHTFGANWMMWIVRHKESGQMAGCGYIIPDVFHLNRKEQLDSVSFHDWVVHPDHRRKYLSMLMYGETSLLAKDRKTPHYINRGSWPVGADNIANANAAMKMGGRKDRSHIILEKVI